VAERIGEAGGAVAVELILHRFLELRAGGDRLLGERVDVGDVQVDGHRGPTERLRAAEAHLRELIGQHDRRIADFELGVPDPPVRLHQAHEFLAAERALVKVERLRCALDAQIGRGTRVVVGNRLRGHRCPPFLSL
jgi:hypothetical protein